METVNQNQSVISQCKCIYDIEISDNRIYVLKCGDEYRVIVDGNEVETTVYDDVEKALDSVIKKLDEIAEQHEQVVEKARREVQEVIWLKEVLKSVLELE